jgi:hypothetical protein
MMPLMKYRLNITAAGNTYNPCLIILQRKGYKLSAEALEDDQNIYTATKGDARFSGYSPPELLGIVVLGEELGEDWNQRSPNVLRSILADGDER